MSSTDGSRWWRCRDGSSAAAALVQTHQRTMLMALFEKSAESLLVRSRSVRSRPRASAGRASHERCAGRRPRLRRQRMLRLWPQVRRRGTLTQQPRPQQSIAAARRQPGLNGAQCTAPAPRSCWEHRRCKVLHLSAHGAGRGSKHSSLTSHCNPRLGAPHAPPTPRLGPLIRVQSRC
jgi:hypothetical protein